MREILEVPRKKPKKKTTKLCYEFSKLYNFNNALPRGQRILLEGEIRFEIGQNWICYSDFKKTSLLKTDSGRTENVIFQNDQFST